MADDSEKQFDPETYLAHYYKDPHPDDDLVLRLTCEALKNAPPPRPLETIDVGTGPNLYPLFAAMPRASAMTAWDYAQANIDWLREELTREKMRPQFEHFWAVTRGAYGPSAGLPENPISELRRKTKLQRGSIFDLPERRWDAGTMFFCAEAVTTEQAEFDKACACYARSVKPGGTLVAAFLLNSASYELDGKRSRLMTLTEDSLRESFAKVAKNIEIRAVGIVKEEVRSGYTGMALLTAAAA